MKEYLRRRATDLKLARLSTFDLGAFEYLTFGGYNSCDDQISKFTVTDTGGAA